MDDAGLVDALEPVAQVLDDLQLPRQRPRALLGNDRTQRLALEVFHDEERVAVMLEVVEDADDVGVLQGRENAGLALEAAAHRVVVDAGPQPLDGHVAIQHAVTREMHRPHATAAEETENLVAIQPVHAWA